MELSAKEKELVLKYVSDELDAEEKILFEELKEKSVEFQQEIITMEVLVAGVVALENAKDLKEIRNTFEEFKQEDQAKAKRSLVVRLSLGLAASISLVVAVFYFNSWQNTQVDPARLYAVNYEVFPLSNASRNEEGLKEGLSDYQNGKFKEAIPKLEKLLQRENDGLIALYLSNALMEVDRYQEAKKVLDELKVKESDWYLNQHKNWYLALIYLHENELKEAKEQFEMLKLIEGGIYKKQSTKILDELK